ncbi:MAG: response regulator [Desulfobacterales bacterium]|jgi:putative nucleotidyltransferase with HDIG domain
MDSNIKEIILFVDDEESILSVSSEYFQRRGYQTRTAKTGAEALQILANERIDCCFTDINMPKMNGLELAERIRNHDNTMPVIVMTGYPSLENTIQTIKNGVVDFLIKPVNLKQMELSLQRVIQQRKMFVENVLLKKEVESKQRLEKLNQELMVKVQELNTLNKIMSQFTAIGSTDDVFTKAVDLACTIAHADMTGFYVINDAVQEPIQVSSSAKSAACGTRSAQASAGTLDPVPSSKNSQLLSTGLIMEVVSDQIPLLITQNSASNGLPAGIKSAMMVPLKIRNKVFGVLTAIVNQGAKRFSEKDLYYLSFLAQSAAQAIENLALYENIYENLFATLYAFVKAVEARDLYTQLHSSRVTGLSIVLGKQLGCSKEELDILKFAGHLHDIGKIGIRDDILLKPGKLTEEEFEKIKDHPVIGASILEQLGLWEKERQIIRCHHERFDGSGYPDGIKQDDIPFLARILSVADVYDAMASNRAYRKKMEDKVILKIINAGNGSQFDPNVVAAFNQAYADGKITRYMKTGEVD